MAIPPSANSNKMIMSNIGLLLMMFIVGLFSCNSTDINGHWHLFEEGVEIDDYYYVMDVEGDSFATFDETHHISNKIRNVDLSKKEIIFDPFFLVDTVSYSLSQGIINFEYWGKTLTGARCEIDCCNKEKDFFRRDFVHVTLPKVEEGKIELVENEKRSLASYIKIGQLKQKESIRDEKKVQIQLNDQLANVEDIPEWLKIERMKVQPQLHRLQKVVIFADSTVELAFVERVRSKIIESEDFGIFLAVNPNRINLEYKPKFVNLTKRIVLKSKSNNTVNDLFQNWNH